MQEKDLIYTQHALAQNGRALRLEYYRLTQPDAHGPQYALPSAACPRTARTMPPCPRSPSVRDGSSACLRFSRSTR